MKLILVQMSFFFSARLPAVYVESDRMEKHRPLYDEQHFQIGAW